MGGWITKPGVGCELLRCFSFQGRQTVCRVYGGLHVLHGLVKLFLSCKGVGPKQETSQQPIQVLHDPVAPRFPEGNEDRLYTKIQTNPHQLAWGTWIQVT